MVDQFILTVDGVPYSIEIKGRQITVNGYTMALETDDDAIKIDGLAHAVELMGSQAIVNGIGYNFEVEWPSDEPEGPPRMTRRAESPAAEGAVTAIMPGKIVRVVVQEGEAVHAGQVVAILEAMKMENELSAPRDGVVKRILIAPGSNVEQGQPLVEVE